MLHSTSESSLVATHRCNGGKTASQKHSISDDAFHPKYVVKMRRLLVCHVDKVKAQKVVYIRLHRLCLKMVYIYLINYLDFYVYFTLLYSEIRSKLKLRRETVESKKNAT